MSFEVRPRGWPGVLCRLDTLAEAIAAARTLVELGFRTVDLIERDGRAA